MSSQTDLVPRVRCPSCGQKVLWVAENKWRPFCSEYCKLIDLGQWASESYRVAGEPARDGTEMHVNQEN